MPKKDGGEGMPDQPKKRSDKQQAASRANGARGQGPVTAQGKKHSSANALKHGLFARELLIPEQDRECFEQLRQALAAELKPDTVLLWILFDDIVSIIWRMRPALRLEQAEMRRLLAPANEAQVDAAGAAIPGVYNVRQRIECLGRLEKLLSGGHRIDESLRAEGAEKLGTEFMADLLCWQPGPSGRTLSQLY